MDALSGLDKRHWAKFASTIITTILLGPAIGAIAFAMLPWISHIAEVGQVVNDIHLAGSIYIGLLAIPFSYIFGGIQATLVGLVLASYGLFYGRPGVGVAILSGLLTSLAAKLAGQAFFVHMDWLTALTVHIVPAVICWSIIRFSWPKILQ